MKKVLGIVGILDSGSLLATALEEKRKQGAFAVQSKMKVILALGVLALGMALGAGAGEAKVITVTGSYTTIQEAVNAAVNGDTITVSAGTYPEV